MNSIYQRAMGECFEDLHPRIQERFGIHSGQGRAAIGRGRMDEIWRGPAYTLPFLYLGSWRNILFPEQGRDVPFEVQSWAYRDALGRETVTWMRSFGTWPRRRFDAYMTYSPRRGVIVDYLGSHQHLAVDIHPTVGEGGAMCLRSGRQRFYEGRLAFRIPGRLTGHAEVEESYDKGSDRFRIHVRVSNPLFGPLFGYHGHFRLEWVDATAGVPPSILSRRVESRD